jgi:hypothetical protein
LFTRVSFFDYVVDLKDADSGFFLESPRSTLEKGTAFSVPTDASSFSSLCSEEENDEYADAPRPTFTVDVDDGASEATVARSSSNDDNDGMDNKCASKKRGIAALLNGMFGSRHASNKRVASAPSLGLMALERTTSVTSVRAVNAPTANGAGGLILESRPAHLPAKSKQEEAKHVLLYRQMLDTAKRKGAGPLLK